MALLGCPFCQELRPSDEGAQCSVCGVDLVPVERMPPSYEARAAEAARLLVTPPEHRRLPITFVRRGRGLLGIACVCGLGLFFAPWIDLTLPTEARISGFDLARHRAPWFWGGAVGWAVLLAVVISRRTIAEMRGVRVVAATFPAMSLVELIVLVQTRPVGNRLVPVQLSWGWGLYATFACALLGVLAGARFGGRLDDIELPRTRGAPLDETSDGETLH